MLEHIEVHEKGRMRLLGEKENTEQRRKESVLRKRKKQHHDTGKRECVREDINTKKHIRKCHWCL